MANEEHIAIVRRGAEAIAQWREENPDMRLDLRGAILAEINLCDIDFGSARLTGADLTRARLNGADLYYACLNGATLRKADLNGANLGSALLVETDLREADLSGTDLNGAILRKADLNGADLEGANLREADLNGANLRKANLRKANLEGANPEGANLEGANLREAILRGLNLVGTNLTRAKLHAADLRSADLRRVDLAGADIASAYMANTILIDTLLGDARNLDYIEHKGPSHLDWNTIRLSRGRLPTKFLQGACPPDQVEEFIAYRDALLRSEDPERIIREIEFEPQYKQAGLSILNYFSEIVENKYPNEDISIRIEQKGHKVRMEITTPDGAVREKVEKTFEEFGLVILGEKAPEDLLDSRDAILSLNHQLRLAEVQIEGLKEISAYKDADIRELKDKVSDLLTDARRARQEAVADAIDARKDVKELAHDVRDIAQQALRHSSPVDILTAFADLQRAIGRSDLTPEKQQEVRQLVADLEAQRELPADERESPDTLKKMADQVETIAKISKTIGDVWTQVGPSITSVLGI